MRVCKECGSELYFEGLLDSNNEVVVVYEEAAICSNRDCEYGQEVHNLWHIEKNTMFFASFFDFWSNFHRFRRSGLDLADFSLPKS